MSLYLHAKASITLNTDLASSVQHFSSRKFPGRLKVSHIFKSLLAIKMQSKMISSVLVTALLSIAQAQTTTFPITGTLGNATIPENNPVGPIYVATLPDMEFFNPDDPRGNIKGSVSATANPDGIGVQFQVQFSNLPTSGGPFGKYFA